MMIQQAAGIWTSSLVRPASWLLAGAAIGLICFAVLRHLPAAWMSSAEEDSQMSPAPQFRVWPDAWILVLSGGLTGWLASLAAQSVIGLGIWLPAAWVWIGAVCVLIATIDAHTRLIPDQLLLALLAGLPLLLLDRFSRVGASWLEIARVTALRLGAGLAAGLILLGLSAVFSRLLRQDSIGFGDIKLIAAAGSLTGFRHLAELFLVGFLLAGIGAAALLASRGLRRRQASAPQEARPGLHGEMALGPYLAAALMLLLLFGDAVQRFLWPT